MKIKKVMTNGGHEFARVFQKKESGISFELLQVFFRT